MPSSLLNPFDIEKVDQIQENLIAYFRLFAGLPGVTSAEEDVTWFVSAKDEPGNHVLRTQISGDSIDRRIDEFISQLSQYTDHIDWLVFPGCQPADLGKRLEARGMRGGPGGTWMLADLTSLPNTPSVPDNFHIKYVSNQRCSRNGNKYPLQALGVMFKSTTMFMRATALDRMPSRCTTLAIWMMSR